MNPERNLDESTDDLRRRVFRVLVRHAESQSLRQELDRRHLGYRRRDSICQLLAHTSDRPERFILADGCVYDWRFGGLVGRYVDIVTVGR